MSAAAVKDWWDMVPSTTTLLVAWKLEEHLTGASKKAVFENVALCWKSCVPYAVMGPRMTVSGGPRKVAPRNSALDVATNSPSTVKSISDILAYSLRHT